MRTRRRLAHLCCLLLFALRLCSARAATEIASVDVGIGGVVRHQHYAMARVTVTHDGAEALRGKVVLRAVSGVRRLEGGTTERDVDLPPNSRKQFELPLRVPHGAKEVKAEVWAEGRRRARRSVKVKACESGDDVIAVIGADDLGLKSLEDSGTPLQNPLGNVNYGSTFNAPTPCVANFDAWRDVPSAWMGYTMMESLVSVGAPASVDREQQRALRQWLRHGGTLIVSAGDSAAALRQSFLEKLLPVTLTDRTISASLRPLALIVGDLNGADARQSFVVCQPRSNARVLIGDERTPYVVERREGRGRVIFLTFDPRREPFRSWSGKTEFWRTLLRWRNGHAYLSPPLVNMSDELIALIRSAKVVNLPSRHALLAPLIVYAIVLVLAVVYTVRIARRKEMTWLVLGGIAALFGFGYCGVLRRAITGQFYAAGITLKSFNPGQGTVDNWFMGQMFFPSRREFDVTIGAPSVRFGGVSSDEDASSPYTLHVGDTFTRLRNVYPQTWSLKALWAYVASDDVKSITAEGGGVGHTFGYRITNRTRKTLRRGRVALIHPLSFYVVSVPDLAPGASASVTVNIETAQRVPRRRGISLWQIQRDFPKASRRAQGELWAREECLQSLNWDWRNYGGVYMAVTDQPPFNVALKGFKQEWYHLVLIPLRGAMPEIERERRQRAWDYGEDLGHLDIAHILKASMKLERPESESGWKFNRGEVVLEYGGIFPPPKRGKYQLVIWTHGKLSGKASLTLAAYNWRTGAWHRWKPNLKQSESNHGLSMDYFYAPAGAVRLKVKVDGASAGSYWQMDWLNAMVIQGMGMPMDMSMMGGMR